MVQSVSPAADLLDRAEQLLERSAYGEAVQVFSAALRLEPENLAGLYGRAEAFRRLGALKPAEADCTRAIELDPHNAHYHGERGFIRFLSDKLEDSLADFDAAIRLTEGSPDPFRLRAGAETASEVEELQGSLTADLYRLRAEVWLARNNVLRATEDFTAACTRNSENVAKLPRGFRFNQQSHRVEQRKPILPQLVLRVAAPIIRRIYGR